MFCFAQPFAARFPEPRLCRDAGRPSVLLVHGYLCNRAGLACFLLDSGELSQPNVATVTRAHPRPRSSGIGRSCETASKGCAQLPGRRRSLLVGHSMGGLALRVYLRKFGDAAVSKVITLATPHHGRLFGPLASARTQSRCRSLGLPCGNSRARLVPALLLKFVCVARAPTTSSCRVRARCCLERARSCWTGRSLGAARRRRGQGAWRTLHDEVTRQRREVRNVPGQRSSIRRCSAQRALLAPR